MAKHIQHKEQKGKKGGMSNATAGAVGAAVGGIVGAAAGIALSDKDKRKMMMGKLDDLKKYVANAVDEIGQMSQEATDIIPEKTTTKTQRKTTTQKRSVN